MAGGREVAAASVPVVVSLNNVSFAWRGAERRVLVHNALHFLAPAEGHLLKLQPRSLRAQIPWSGACCTGGRDRRPVLGHGGAGRRPGAGGPGPAAGAREPGQPGRPRVPTGGCRRSSSRSCRHRSRTWSPNSGCCSPHWTGVSSRSGCG
ncbi:hypothetical protein NKG94_19875 [Micromonospora sp. M12]